MKKRIIGLMLMLCMVVGQFSAVSANPSPKDEFNVITDGYEVEILEDDDYLDNIPEGMKPISPVFELQNDGADGCDDGKYRAEFYVPDLTDNVTEPIYAYVTYEDGRTEVLEAIRVDYENKTVVFAFDCIPAKAVFYAGTLELDAVGQAPKTGVMSTWGIWIALAVVLAAAAAVVSKKSRA